jgi:hypothetical protein
LPHVDTALLPCRTGFVKRERTKSKKKKIFNFLMDQNWMQQNLTMNRRNENRVAIFIDP